MRALATVLLAALLAPSSSAFAQVAELISRNSAGVPADNHSYRPTLSSDGRYVAFESWASNLAAGVNVDNSGVFVRDLLTGTTVLASTSDAGNVPDGKSYMADISGDGRLVAFWSQAANLVPDDTNGEEDLFVYDRVGRTVTRANVSSTGVQAEPADHNFHIVGTPPSLSADGRFVAFDSSAGNLVPGDTNGVRDVFVRDRQAGTTERISLKSDLAQASLPSSAPSISADGRYVAFISQDSLTPDDTNGQFDVYVFDRQAAALERIGVTFGSAPAISGDGRFVAFESDATGLVSGDTNGKDDVFVYDRTAAQMTRVSVASDGTQGNGDSSEPAISGDGRYVAFTSAATNLVAGDSNASDDVFVHDRVQGTTTRISVLPSGLQTDSFSRVPALDGDGYFIAFESAATNLGFGDNFGADDVVLGVLYDICLDDPNKLFPGVCGCGVPDNDADHDGTFDCDDGCPNDPNKTSPGECGCGLSDVDTDGDGTLDCHDPATAEALAALAREAIAAARQLTARTSSREALVTQLRSLAAYLTAAENNAAFSRKQKQLLSAAAQALTRLADATGRSVTGRKAKALRVLRKLLKTTR